jgi:iron complex transport system substrate-binding protein
MRADIASVTAAVERIEPAGRPKVFLEIWHSPLMTAGKGSIIDEIITLAGGVNIAHDTISPYSSFSPEEVVRRDPGCIVLAYMQKGDSVAAVKNRLGWGAISAVRSGRVYNDIEPDMLLRPGPRIVNGLKNLHERFYPE